MSEQEQGFFHELRRRNVFRVGAAYLVIAWLVAQIAELGLDSFEAPGWVIKALLLVLLLGFPLALFFAWVFELTPEGIKRESEVDRSASVTSVTGQRLNYVIIGLLSISLVYFVANHDWGSDSAADSELEQQSVAVLPFADLSENGDQEYFADGISEEILNVLVRIPGLKVAGRTSSFSFKGRNEDLREIGAALGVNHVLEGSVRRAGDRLRITTQLVRSDDGFHVWSDNYDRQVADIFDIQDEIARAVADALARSLGLTIATQAEARTSDVQVYENYLQARRLFQNRGKENLDEALLLLNEATTRDPEFAPAWTLIAAVYGVYEAYAEREVAEQNYQQWRATGRAAAERSLTLQPDSAEAHAMLGTFLFYAFDFIPAVREFDRAVELAPDNPEVLDAVAQSLRELGYAHEANELAIRSVALDPLSAIRHNTLAQTYGDLNNPEQALTHSERAIDIDPSLPFPHNIRMWVYMELDDAEAFTAAAQAVEGKGILPADVIERRRSVFAVRDDPDGLRALAAANPDDRFFGGYMYFLANDFDAAADLYAKEIWSQEYRQRIELFGAFQRQGEFDHPLWKEQVRRDGLLALWQSRGFPKRCRPTGDDDFECRV